MTSVLNLSQHLKFVNINYMLQLEVYLDEGSVFVQLLQFVRRSLNSSLLNESFLLPMYQVAHTVDGLDVQGKDHHGSRGKFLSRFSVILVLEIF